jgi:nitrogen fixation NifU-like protein
VAKIDVAPSAEFPPGSTKIVTVGWTSIGVYNCNGKLYAIEDRCSHDDGPLCGDEVTIFVRFGEDGETIDDVGFEGRGCAISQAATSMLTELVKGRTAADVAALPKEDLLEEIGIPLTPVRLKCAILGLGVLKVALHRAKGTPLPPEWQGLADDLTI